MSIPIYRRDREFSAEEISTILEQWIITKARETDEEPVTLELYPRLKRSDGDWSFNGYTAMIRTEQIADREKRIMASIDNKHTILDRDEVEGILQARLTQKAAIKGEQAMNFSLAPISRDGHFDGYDADYQVSKPGEGEKIKPHPKMPWHLKDDSLGGPDGKVSITYHMFYQGEYVGTIDLGSLDMKDPKYRHKQMALGEIAMMMINALQHRGGLYPFIDCDENE